MNSGILIVQKHRTDQKLRQGQEPHLAPPQLSPTRTEPQGLK